MSKLRHAIVDAVCRALGVDDRGFAKRRGNIIDVLVDAGCDPRVVVKQAAAVAGVSVVTTRLLERAPPAWPDGVDVMACLSRGVIAVAKGKGGEWCFAYLDPEDAADHEVVGVSLDLPPHRPVLGLRTQLMPFIQAADPFQATPTQVLPTMPVLQAGHHDDKDDVLEEVGEVDSDDDDTFNPSLVDGAPIDAPINDPLGGHTISDTGDDDPPRDPSFDTLPAKQKTPQFSPFADRLDDSAQAGSRLPAGHPLQGRSGPGVAAAPPPRTTPDVARADITNDDEDGGFFVDDTERLSQATGLKRPPTRAPAAASSLPPPPSSAFFSSPLSSASSASSSSPSRLRDSDTQPLEAPKPMRSSSSTTSTSLKPAAKPTRTKPTKPTKPTNGADDDVPAWKKPPPQVRPVSQQAVLVGLACFAVVAGGGLVWRLGSYTTPKQSTGDVVVDKTGGVDVGPKQQSLIEDAARTSSPQLRERLLNMAVALDPHSVEGLRAVQARAAVLVALGRKGAATRDLEALKRGVLVHKDAVAAADLKVLENTIVSMPDTP